MLHLHEVANLCVVPTDWCQNVGPCRGVDLEEELVVEIVDGTELEIDHVDAQEVGALLMTAS